MHAYFAPYAHKLNGASQGAVICIHMQLDRVTGPAP